MPIDIKRFDLNKDNKTQKETCVTCKYLGKSMDVCTILPGKSIKDMLGF